MFWATLAACDHGEYSKGKEDVCVKETRSQAAAATCGHVEKYASPVPRAWAVFAVFDVYFIANQLHWGKKKGSKITFFLLIGCEPELGSWWVWEEGESPWGTSLGGLEKPNSPNCQRVQGVFLGPQQPVQ